MPKRILPTLIFGLMLPVMIPALAQEPSVKFPACDSFREVYDQWNQTPEVPGRHIKITVTP
ncbi:MAG: hypothetical protein FWD31_04240, partial [Planctomycetaceae bacterium]|nr:hypothetical protein [Planctomycetaceae bacterium]